MNGLAIRSHTDIEERDRTDVQRLDSGWNRDAKRNKYKRLDKRQEEVGGLGSWNSHREEEGS